MDIRRWCGFRKKNEHNSVGHAGSATLGYVTSEVPLASAATIADHYGVTGAKASNGGGANNTSTETTCRISATNTVSVDPRPAAASAEDTSATARRNQDELKFIEMEDIDEATVRRNQAELKFSEIEDGDEVIERFFKSIDLDNDGRLSWSEVKAALSACPSSEKLVDFLKTIEEGLRSNPADGLSKNIDLARFKEILKKVPRIHGERYQWVKSMNLNMLLARRLRLGNIFDELSGIREMNDTEMEAALALFAKDVVSVVKSEWSLLKKTGSSRFGPSGVKAAMSKYAGTVGTFGDTQMFQEGLESQLGSPDPFILTGILRDNVLSDQSRERSVTSNYKIVFSLAQEYARVLGNPSEYERDPLTKLEEKDTREDIPIFLMEVAKGLHPEIKGPKEAELKDLSTAFQKLRKLHEEVGALNQGVFPGDIGNVQQSMEIEFELSDKESARHCHKKLLEFIADRAAEKHFFVDPGQTPDSESFRLSIYGSLSFFSSREDQALIESLKTSHPCARIQKRSGSDRVYIYCNLKHGKPLNLRDILISLDLSDLSQISAQDQSILRDEQINIICDQVQREASSRIVCMQGRRHLSLRQLMDLKEIKGAGLRVEEAIQAYQYTGPLFQVIDTLIDVCHCLILHGLSSDQISY